MKARGYNPYRKEDWEYSTLRSMGYSSDEAENIQSNPKKLDKILGKGAFETYMNEIKEEDKETHKEVKKTANHYHYLDRKGAIECLEKMNLDVNNNGRFKKDFEDYGIRGDIKVLKTKINVFLMISFDERKLTKKEMKKIDNTWYNKFTKHFQEKNIKMFVDYDYNQ